MVFYLIFVAHTTKVAMETNTHTLETIYKEHYALLLNYGLKFSRDKELVKDCIQDVFVKLHRSGKLPQTGIVRSYLLKALRNTLYDRINSAKETAELEFAFHLPDTENLFDRFFSRSDEDVLLAKRLVNALNELPTNQKTALYLRYIREMSYNEIADVLDIKVQSSMNLISRSLTNLRGLLKNDYLILALYFIGQEL